MSFLTKITQGFAGAGVIATIPFALARDPEEQEINIFRSGGGEQALTIKKLLEEKGETGYQGCVSLEGNASTVLFVCAKKEALNKPIFYYYDWRSRNQQEKLNKVKSLTLKYSLTSTMKFDNNQTKDLQNSPTWLNKWGRKEFIPEQHCEIKKPNETSTYKLICTAPSGGSSNSTWSQDI